jgi:hypothetical protein
MKNCTLKRTIGILMIAAALVGSQAASLAGTVTVVNDVTNNTTWFKTNTYLLDGYIYVRSNTTLTIEAGTVIKGAATPTSGENVGALFITQGAKIMANGTASEPIIFTAEDDDLSDPLDLGIYDRGLWGGVVILGNAPINTVANLTNVLANPKVDVFEGLPDTQVNGQFVNRFGGGDPADNSGVFRYVSIRHGGYAFLPNKELNGLSLGGVGNGTTIEYVETYATADDGFEFFGGTVNTKYLVSAFNDDDAFDTDQGYTGKNQFWFAIQENGRRDNGGELNGEPNGLAVSNAPISNFTVYNATWLGAGPGTQNTNANHGFTIREYSAPRIYNSIVTDFNNPTNTASVAVRITDARSGTMLTNGLLDLRDNLFWGFGTYSNAAAALLFTDGARSNTVANPQLTSISRTNDHLLDPRPAAGSPALSSPRTAPNDGFYTPVAYKGAFDANNLWLRGWTFLDKRGFLSTTDPGVPPPQLSIARVGNNVDLSFPSQTGVNYQVQSIMGFSGTSLNWASEGGLRPGTGSPITVSLPIDSTMKFYRVVVP